MSGDGAYQALRGLLSPELAGRQPLGRLADRGHVGFGGCPAPMAARACSATSAFSVLDFATYAAASDVTSLNSRIKTFHKAPGDRIGDYTLDANDSVVITAELANGALGPIQATRWATGNLNDIRLNLYGDKGALRVMTDGKLIVASARRGRRPYPDLAGRGVPTGADELPAICRGSSVAGQWRSGFRRGAACSRCSTSSFSANGLGTLEVDGLDSYEAGRQHPLPQDHPARKKPLCSRGLAVSALPISVY